MSLQKKNLTNVLKFLLFFAVSILFLAGVNFESLKVLSPVALTFLSFVIFYHRTRRIEGDRVFAHLGIFYALVVSIYVSLPLIGFVLRGMNYDINSNLRLLQLNPTPDQIAMVGLYGACHVVAFSAAFSFFCNKDMCFEGDMFFKPIKLQKEPKAQAVLLVFLVSMALMFFLSVSLSLSSKSYLDCYVALWQLPLFLRQIANHVSGIYVIAFICVLAHWFGNFRQYKFVIVVFLAYEFISTIISMGGRSEITQFLIVVAMLYHLLVKKLKGKVVFISIIAGVALLLAYGELRSISIDGGEVAYGKHLITENNEFESLLATGVEMQAACESKQLPEIPLQLRFSDLFSLIPQQLLPFQKLRFADWYLDNFHPAYKRIGGGLAFGAVPEALVGFGFTELILRAIVLGWLFSLVHRWYLARRTDFWATCFYIWLTVESYQCFRAGTFVLFIYIFYRFVPYCIVVKGLSSLMRRLIKSS